MSEHWSSYFDEAEEQKDDDQTDRSWMNEGTPIYYPAEEETIMPQITPQQIWESLIQSMKIIKKDGKQYSNKLHIFYYALVQALQLAMQPQELTAICGEPSADIAANHICRQLFAEEKTQQDNLQW